MAIKGMACRPFPTYLLLEAIVPSEYNALSDNQKEKLKIIISCGTIDTRIDNPIREDLFTLFPEGTETYDKLNYLFTPTPPLE